MIKVMRVSSPALPPSFTLSHKIPKKSQTANNHTPTGILYIQRQPRPTGINTHHGESNAPAHKQHLQGAALARTATARSMYNP